MAQCQLEAPDAAQQLEVQQTYPRVRGVRQIVGRHAEEDRKHGSDALLHNPAWLAGLKLLAARGLSFDLQMIQPLHQVTTQRVHTHHNHMTAPLLLLSCTGLFPAPRKPLFHPKPAHPGFHSLMVDNQAGGN